MDSLTPFCFSWLDVDHPPGLTEGRDGRRMLTVHEDPQGILTVSYCCQLHLPWQGDWWELFRHPGVPNAALAQQMLVAALTPYPTTPATIGRAMYDRLLPWVEQARRSVRHVPRDGRRVNG